MEIRSDEILNIEKIMNKNIHIIGCGATGSHLAIQLVKLGANKLYLWDFDTVEAHNLTNQIWEHEDIGKTKIDTLVEKILKINPFIPERNLIKRGKWEGQFLEGIIFCCVDSMELRKEIYETNQYNSNIQIMFDPRLGSTTGSVFTYIWNDKNIEELIKLSNFKDDEIDVERSLCGTPINIGTTLQAVVNYLLINFINYLNGESYYQQVYFEPLKYKTTYLQKI
jgi:molybdopterin/thiamine biosynthesis adenylyltransferase